MKLNSGRPKISFFPPPSMLRPALLQDLITPKSSVALDIVRRAICEFNINST